MLLKLFLYKKNFMQRQDQSMINEKERVNHIEGIIVINDNINILKIY